MTHVQVYFPVSKYVVEARDDATGSSKAASTRPTHPLERGILTITTKARKIAQFKDIDFDFELTGFHPTNRHGTGPRKRAHGVAVSVLVLSWRFLSRGRPSEQSRSEDDPRVPNVCPPTAGRLPPLLARELHQSPKVAQTRLSQGPSKAVTQEGGRKEIAVGS